MARYKKANRGIGRCVGIFFGVVIALIVIALAASWITGYALTGEYNPASWATVQIKPDEDDETDEIAPASLHIHAKVMRVMDENDLATVAATVEISTEYVEKCPYCGRSTEQEFYEYGNCYNGNLYTVGCYSCSWYYVFNDLQTINPDKHNIIFTRQISAPTCAVAGSALYTCSYGCGTTETRTVSATGNHNYSWVKTSYPVNGSAGVESYMCSTCSSVTQTRNFFALPADPVKEGYHFVGWYKDEALNIPYDSDYIYSDTALYAKFEINQYTVTFDTDGGSAVDSVSVDWNAPLTITLIPTKEGYNFDGWYKSDGTQFVDGEAVTGHITLTAHWQIKVFTVTFYVEGEVYATVQVEYGAVLSEVADVAAIYARNIISFANVNSDTPDISAFELIVMDDMTVFANAPTAWDWVLTNWYYLVGMLVVIIAIGAVVSIVAKKPAEKA